MPAAASTLAPLRVLIVEDSATDAELFLRALRQAGFDPVFQRVETERDYLAHLGPDLDVILADDQLPLLDGMRALQLANERAIGVPFIIVSGTVGEDLAVAAMKQGASDYLLKDRLTRLGSAVRHAIEATALRRAGVNAERSARRGEARNAAMLEAVRDGIFLVDDAQTITEFNPAAERMFGLTRADAIGRAIGELLEPSAIEGASGTPLRVTLAATGLPRQRLEMTARRADGSSFPVELTLSRLSAQGDAQIAGVFRDISERKSHEAAGLERQRQSAFAQDVGVAFTKSTPSSCSPAPAEASRRTGPVSF